MKIIKIILSVVAFTGITLAGLYLYFIYVPAPQLPQLKGSYTDYSLKQNSLTRSYHVYTPAQLAEVPAVVFVLHGSMSSGNEIREMTAGEFDLLADEYQNLVVYPDGYDRHWNDCRGSGNYKANLDNIDDEDFFRQIIAHLQHEYDIDSNRLYITGFSNGGHMAYALAMGTPELFSAYAPIAASMPAENNRDCVQLDQAVSIAIFNGTNDPVNPYEGGLVQLFGDSSRGEVMSTQQTFDYWQKLAGSDGELTVIHHPEKDENTNTSVVEQRWLSRGIASNSTASGSDIRLFRLEGSGHVIPSRQAKFSRIMGGDAGDISGPEEIMAFFFREQKAR